MRKGMHKLMYILGTTLIFLGTLMSTVMSVVQASTVTGVSSSLTSSVTTSSKDDSNSSKNVVSSSKSSTTPIENESSVSITASKSSESSIHSQASSESSSSQVASSNSSRKAESSATSRRAQNLAATASSTPTAQKIGETNIRTLDAGTDGAYDHFRTSEGDVTYCYNWQLSTPDKINGTKYNQYQFYDGMKDVTGDQQKVAKVAAALEAGYHKDADTGKYNVAPQFQDLAQSSFEDTVASSEYRGFIPSSNYTLSQYEEDVTQSVIWYLDGAPDTITTDAYGQVMQPGYMATHTALGRAILSYAQNHPLDQETAYPKNVAVKDATGTVNDSHPLVMDSQTKESQPFQLSGYNGGVQITDLPKGYEIVDENGNKVTQVESGKNYRVKYVGNGNPSNTTANNTVNKIQAKANYESLKESNYFSAQLKDNPLTNNPYQNMVNLTTTENSFMFPIVWQTSSSSSSSSSVSSSSSKETSSSSVESSSSSKISSSNKSSSSSKSNSSSKSTSSSMKSTSSKSSSMNTNSKSSSSMKSASSSNKNTNSSSENNSSKNTSSTNGAVNNESSSTVRGVVAGNGSGNEGGKGNGQGQGEGNGTGHGMPQTGEAISTAMIVVGIILVATAGMITLKKRN